MSHLNVISKLLIELEQKKYIDQKVYSFFFLSFIPLFLRPCRRSIIVCYDGRITV